MGAHPSFRELDRIALGDDLPLAHRHASACDACAAYLGSHPAPHMTAPLAAPRRRRLPRLALIGAPALAAAAVAVALLLPSPPKEPWVATKGAPSVSLFVMRGATLSRWDGSAPFQPGDRIRLRVAPQGFTHVAVAAFDPLTKTWVPLFEGEVAGDEKLLPGSWELDAAPGSERILVALDTGPVRLDGAAWSRELVLPKSESPAP